MQGVLLWLIRHGLARVVADQLLELVGRMEREGRIPVELARVLAVLLAALGAASKSSELSWSKQVPPTSDRAPASPGSSGSPATPVSPGNPPSKLR